MRLKLGDKVPVSAAKATFATLQADFEEAEVISREIEIRPHPYGHGLT